MANIYKDIIKEIYNRLDTNKGKIDIGVKRVVVGTRELIQGHQDTPSIAIELVNFREVLNVKGNRQLHSEMQIALNCMYPVANENKAEMYYDEANETGLIHFIEDVMDVVNETTAGANGYLLTDLVKQHMAFSFGNVQKQGNFYTFDILIDLVTKNFAFNARKY